MRTFVTAVAAVLIAGSACAQFKANQTSTAGAQAAATINPATQSLDEARRIQRDEAIQMVKEGKAVWIDVRQKSDYDAGHIKGAMNIPLAELPANFSKLPPHKFLITYCAWAQEHTSARAVLDLNAHGIKNTAALLGGWGGWVQAKLPVESTATQPAPVKK